MSDSTKCLRVWYDAYALRLFYIFNIGQPAIFQVESLVSRWLSNSHYLMLAVSCETFFINSLKQFAEAFPRVKNSDVLLSVSRRLCWYLCRRLCWYLCRRLCWYLCRRLCWYLRCLKSDFYLFLSCLGMKIGTLTRFTVSVHFFCLFLGSLFSKQKVAVEPILQKFHIIHWLFAWRNLLSCYVV